jgi:hypothetical protein
MTAIDSLPETLERTIGELKQQQRDAWAQLSRPSLTKFESKELRNQIRQSGEELRRCLSQRAALYARVVAPPLAPH